MKVTLYDDNNNSKVVDASDFEANGITVSPVNGKQLTVWIITNDRSPSARYRD